MVSKVTPSSSPVWLYLPSEEQRQLAYELRSSGRMVAEQTSIPAGSSILVVDLRRPGWESAIAEHRYRDPGARVVAVAESLAQACRLTNEFRVDRVVPLGEPSQLLAQVRRLSAPQRTPTAVGLRRLTTGPNPDFEQLAQQWKQSLDALSEPFALMEPSFRIERANRAYADHVGCSVVQLGGQICYELRSRSRYPFAQEPAGPCRECPVNAALSSGRSTSAVISDQHDRRWEVTAYLVDTDRGRRVGCHYRDVTAEAQRLTQLARADKLSAVGKLAGAVAHELNSPMTSIMVFSESLVQKVPADAEIGEHAQQIHQAALRCRRLVQGLLGFARRRRPERRERVDIAAVVADVRQLVGHRCQVGGVKLCTDLAPALESVAGHVADVEHILMNLVCNALEACKRGCTIRITARNLPEDDAVQLRVADDGQGMSAEQLRQAFDPFYTTSRDGRAAGLGLTICEAVLAELHGGIELDSKPGQGTVARVTLPTAARFNVS